MKMGLAANFSFAELLLLSLSRAKMQRCPCPIMFCLVPNDIKCPVPSSANCCQ